MRPRRLAGASVRPLNFTVMRRSIAVVVLLAACATKPHPPDTAAQCAISPSSQWTRLMAPPPEWAAMLAVVRKPVISLTGESVKEAWFRSSDGVVRYCKYGGSTGSCYATSGYFDFQFEYGRWSVKRAGGLSSCISNPKQHTASPEIIN